MAGRVVVSTLNDDTGVLATQNGMSGIAKAWVNFNGSGSASILGSFNVSSVSRSSTGVYVVNFTTTLPNANYSVCMSSTGPQGVQYFMTVDSASNGGSPSNKTTSAITIRNTGAPGQADGASVSFVAFSS